MNWLLLIVAGIFEVAFAFCLGKAKTSSSLATYLWHGGFLVTTSTSLLLLIRTIQYLPIGTYYAVWTAIRATGTVLIGIIIFKDPINFWRILFLTTLIISIIGLKLSST